MRIGLTQRVITLQHRDERRDCLDHAYIELIVGLGWTPVPIPTSIPYPEALLADLQLDGVLLTGGNDLHGLAESRDSAPERDRLEHRLIDACGARGLPLLGVCRGLQIIVDHYGGHLVAVQGHVARSHHIVPVHGTWFVLEERRVVNSFHRYAVWPPELGPVLQAAALAFDGTVEAVVHPTRPQRGIMWHPERAPHDPRDLALLRACFEGPS